MSLLHWTSVVPQRQTTVQGSAKRRSPGLVNFVAAVAYHCCLALPAGFMQPGTLLLAEHCTDGGTRGEGIKTLKKLCGRHLCIKPWPIVLLKRWRVKCPAGAASLTESSLVTQGFERGHVELGLWLGWGKEHPTSDFYPEWSITTHHSCSLILEATPREEILMLISIWNIIRVSSSTLTIMPKLYMCRSQLNIE